MPNHYDFSTLENIKEIKISPFGWINPLTVEYGVNPTISGDTYFWRVKGTLHTFSILVNRMNYLSSGNHAHHFTEVLEKFREDYIDWKTQSFKARWMQDYINEYDRFVI